MRILLLSIVLLSISQSAVAGRTLFSCRGETTDEKVRFHGSVDFDKNYAKTLIVDWTPKSGSQNALPARRWQYKGRDLALSRLLGTKYPSIAFKWDSVSGSVDEPAIYIMPNNVINAVNTNWHVVMKTGHETPYGFNDRKFQSPRPVTCSVTELDTPTKVATYDLCYDNYEACVVFMERNRRQPTLADRNDLIWGRDN